MTKPQVGQNPGCVVFYCHERGNCADEKKNFEDGLITGVSLIPILGEDVKGVKLTQKLEITPKGIEYLQENSAMQKAKSFLKGLKEVIPGL